MARYNGRLHCIVGVLPTCYKRKAAIYFYPPGGTGPAAMGFCPKDSKTSLKQPWKTRHQCSSHRRSAVLGKISISKRNQIQSSLIRVYNAILSAIIFWMPYCTVKSNFSIFRTSTVIILGAPIFRQFTVR